MSAGLLALLDDVAALVKVTAASLDDVAAQVAKTGSKVTGVVIDDAAVTPKYVVGLDPSRELSIIWRIARSSLINKLLILGPAALVLGLIAPWIITPILMVGGAYLCFEGYEKVHTMLAGHHDVVGTDTPPEGVAMITPEELEKERIGGAVRTDFILSAEIIAIAYATVADRGLPTQIVVLAAVAIGITLAVYGFVALIVKADDFGVHLARPGRPPAVRAFGRGLVKGMPAFLKALGFIGMLAMLWVGAEIIAHGIPPLEHGLHGLETALHGVPVLAVAAKIVLCAAGGLAVGWVVAMGVGAVGRLRAGPKTPPHGPAAAA